MLLVTVFLLQLREVTHPDVLARLIRPQEPQPDLLGNLMNETVLTHIKRMILSLAIYAPLLSLHIYLPIKLFTASGLDAKLPFFHLNFYHLVTPQLQIPLELIVFHLSMLALLERYKNSIGFFQHTFLKFMCRNMGLTEHLLPRKIDGFVHMGNKPVFVSREQNASFEVDPFFVELAKKEENLDFFVTSNIEMIDMTSHAPLVVQGETRGNGEKVLSIDTSHVILPACSDVDENDTFLLPTKIGRFRLRLKDNHTDDFSGAPTIEFFREIQGEEIPRPPEVSIDDSIPAFLTRIRIVF
jgi:E3 ubiquitin-protein ligase MARCH6